MRAVENPETLEARNAALADLDMRHSFGERTDDNTTGECLECGDGRGGTPCLHRRYSSRQRKFIRAHYEEYLAAYENPGSAYASNVRARLDEELNNLSRGHVCSEPGGCPFENKDRGIPACPVCRARWQALANQMCERCQKLPRQFRPKGCSDCAALGGMELGAELGRTSPVNAPMPMPLLLDYFAGNM